MKKLLFSFLTLLILIPTLSFSYSIGIDVGHFSSGTSRGAIAASGTPENEYNKQVAMAVKEEFEKRGQSAFLIENMNLHHRTKVSNIWADVFLSIHHDSVSDRMVPFAYRFSGFSLFISKQNSQYKQSLKLAKLIGSEMVQNGFSVALHHHSDKRRQRLLVDKDSGVYRSDRLVVIKETKVPAVLVECGVIKNLYEESWLLKPEIRKKLVNSIVNGTEKFMKNSGGENETSNISKKESKDFRKRLQKTSQ